MVRVGGIVAVLLVAARIVHAQPAEPPAGDAPAPPQPQPQVTPPQQPASPAPPPPAAEPAPPPSAYDQCMQLRRRLGAEADGTQDLKERTRLLQSMPECKPDMTDAPSAPAEATEEQSDGTGFALEVHMETALTVINNDTGLSGTQAGLFLGHRGRSVTIGIALDVGRVAQSTSDSTGNSTSHSSNMVLFMPGLRAVLARSRDEKTELLGEADVGYGRIWISDDTSMDASPSTGHFRVQAAPGLRYWVSPSFAVGAVGGVRYDRYSRSQELGPGSTTNTASLTALFSSLQLTGVF